MPPVLTTSGVSLCSHGGACTALVPSPRVRLSGSPVIAQTSPWVVAGCPALAAQPPQPGCISASFVTGSSRVRVNGQPVLLQSSVGIGSPSATPIRIVTPGQSRVRAT
jgi:hypothetical protein